MLCWNFFLKIFDKDINFRFICSIEMNSASIMFMTLSKLDFAKWFMKLIYCSVLNISVWVAFVLQTVIYTQYENMKVRDKIQI